MSGVKNIQQEATSKDYYFDSYAHFGIVSIFTIKIIFYFWYK